MGRACRSIGSVETVGSIAAEAVSPTWTIRLLCKMIMEGGACMEMAYREQWAAEIAEMRRVLGGFAMNEECKWGKPTYTVDGKNVVILQGFKEYFGLGFFQGALLKDPRNVLVQLGQVHAGRVMKFTSAKDIAAKAATIKAYVREAIAVE